MSGSTRQHRAAAAIAAAAAAAVHAPAIGGSFVNWDDPRYVLRNELARAPADHGLVEWLTTPDIGYPIPLTVAAYSAQRAAFRDPDARFGVDPRGFHAVSVALHAIVAALAVAFALRLGATPAGAALGASLFAVHPVTVEPVAWVTGQKDLLAAVCCLAALTIRAGPRGGDRRRSAACGLLAIAALAAKPSAVGILPALWLVDRARRRPLRSRRAAALYGALTAAVAADIALSLAGHRSHGVSPLADFGVTSLAHAGWSYALQLLHVVWPTHLAARYVPPTGWALVGWALAGAGLAAATAAAAAWLWRTRSRAAGLAIAAAGLAYLPAGGILPLPRGPADSYAYLPLAIAAAAVALGVGRALAATAGAERAAVAAAAVVAVATAATTTRHQIPVWRDSIALWSHAVAIYPDRPQLAMRLGEAYLFEGQPDRAARLFDAIESRYRGFDLALGAHADALALLGRTRDAERYYARAAAAHGRAARETYALFVVSQPDVTPSDPALARRGLIELAPTLAARGKRAATVDRAATLLERWGEPSLAAALRERAAALRRRAAGGAR